MTRTVDAVSEAGRWDRDNSHFPLPISRYFWELFAPAYLEGAPHGFARYGSLIGQLDLARFKGRVYQRVHYVDDPDELQRRQRAADQAISQKLWRTDRAAWPAIRESLRGRLLQLARREPLSMDALALQQHLSLLNRIFHEGVVQHFVQQPASLFPVGDWIQQTCRSTDVSSSEAIALLSGFCSETSDFILAIDRIVDAIRSSGDPSLEPLEQGQAELKLEQLRELSADAGAAFDAYFDEYADRILTGFDATDQTLRELPQFTLAVIAARCRHAQEDSLAARPAAAAEQTLRERMPADMRDEFDQGLSEARAAYGLHDADIRITYLWPLGLIRRALLAAADHLVQTGALERHADIFQATPQEVHSLLLGRNGPSAAELADRADEWIGWRSEETPSSFGEMQPPPSLDHLHPACKRMNAAITFYISQMEARRLEPAQPSWSMLVEGIPASPGRYEGWARVIRGPEDFASLQSGDVLVARTTSPAYNVLLPLVGAVVTDRGGALCHTAIIAREFGLPAVVGAEQATARIPDGARVLVDGDRGFVAVRTG